MGWLKTILKKKKKISVLKSLCKLEKLFLASTHRIQCQNSLFAQRIVEEQRSRTKHCHQSSVKHMFPFIRAAAITFF